MRTRHQARNRRVEGLTGSRGTGSDCGQRFVVVCWCCERRRDSARGGLAGGLRKGRCVIDCRLSDLFHPGPSPSSRVVAWIAA